MSGNSNDNSKYAGKTALLIEDDPDCLAQVKERLEALGFKTICGESQEEGEKFIEEGGFDVAIFDLMLEYQDSGFILCHRAKKKNPSMPVIMITCVSSKTGIHFDLSSEEASSAWIKADAILDKQIRFEQLERELDRLLA